MKTENDVIQILFDNGAENIQSAINALLDGEALLALGLSNEDQQVIENAIAELKERIEK